MTSTALRLVGRGLLFLVISCVAIRATAEPIRLFETATIVEPPPVVGALGLNEIQFVGVRFAVSAPVVLQQVGAHIFEGRDAFFAIVRLSDAADLPDSIDLSTADVLGTGRIVAPSSPAEYADGVGRLQLPLASGWYGLVLGKGLFGVDPTPVSGLSRGNTPIGDPSFFITAGVGGGLAWVELSPQGLRMFADADVNPIPEPATVVLLGTGAVAIICRVRRRSPHGVEPRAGSRAAQPSKPE